jgi:hypothetical protein
MLFLFHSPQCILKHYYLSLARVSFIKRAQLYSNIQNVHIRLVSFFVHLFPSIPSTNTYFITLFSIPLHYPPLFNLSLRIVKFLINTFTERLPVTSSLQNKFFNFTFPTHRHFLGEDRENSISQVTTAVYVPAMNSAGWYFSHKLN